jgi:inosine-uridine nucleoside N-ribohydrolase
VCRLALLCYERTKVHLDADIDDLCALALLLAWPGVEHTGITTSVKRYEAAG